MIHSKLGEVEILLEVEKDGKYYVLLKSRATYRKDPKDYWSSVKWRIDKDVKEYKYHVLWCNCNSLFFEPDYEQMGITELLLPSENKPKGSGITRLFFECVNEGKHVKFNKR